MPKEISEKEFVRSLPEQLLEAVGHAVIATDLAGDIIYWNRAAEDLYGWEADEAVGRNVLDVTPTVSTRLPSARIFERLRSGQSWTGEITLRRKDGSAFPAEVTNTPIFGESGELVGVVGVSIDISAKLEARERASATARRNELILDNSLDVICTFDREANFVSVSEASERLWGYTPAELVGRHHSRILVPEDRARTASAAQRVRRGAELKHFRNRIVRKDGRISEMLWTSTWSEEDGLSFAVGRDVTEENARRRALSAKNAALKSSERRLRSFIDATTLVVWTADADGLLVDISNVFTELTGVSKEDCIGWKWTEFIHAEDRQRVINKWNDHFSRKDVYETEFRVAGPDGSYIWLSVRAVPVFDDDGNLLEWIGTCNDINARKHVEAELRASEQRYRNIVDTTNEGVWLVDADARTTFVNACLEEMLGYSALEMLGKPFMEFVDDADRATAEERFDQRQQGIRETYELLFRRRDGQPIWLMVSASPFYDDAGRFAGALGMITDITERKDYEQGLIEAKEKAEQLSSLKSALLSNMSHEIRTPLTSILGFAQIITEGAPEELGEYAELMQHSGRRLKQTFDAVLEMAELEAGDVELAPSEVDLMALLRMHLVGFEAEAAEKGLYIHLDAAGETLPVTIDPKALERVLSKLLSNALKFTPEGGVVVKVDHTDSSVRIEISDTGIGISADFLPQMFDDFKQESEGLTRCYDGAGLGLSIAKRLTELLGGRIDARSEKGGGTTFTIDFPRTTPILKAA